MAESEATFAELLDDNMDNIEAPKPLPPGNWLLATEKYEMIQSKQQGTPATRIHFKVIAPQEEVDMSELEGLDYSDYTLQADFWLTPKAKYRLKEFLEKCGCNIHGRTFKEVLPECVGMQIKAYVVKTPSNKAGDDRMFNNIQSFSSVSG